MDLARHSTSAPRGGLAHDYLSQLLASLKEVRQTCCDEAALRRDGYEPHIAEFIEAPVYTEQLFFASCPLHSCAFVSREAAKLCEISSGSMKAALNQPEKRHSQQSSSSTSLTARSEKAKAEATELRKESTGKTRKSPPLEALPRPDQEKDKENVKTASLWNCNRAGTTASKKEPTSPALLVSTPVRPATQASLRSVQQPSSSVVHESKLREVVKSKVNTPGPSPSLIPEPPSRQGGGGVRALMRKFEAQNPPSEKPSLKAGGKSGLSSGQVAAKEGAAPVALTPYLKEPLPAAASSRGTSPVPQAREPAGKKLESEVAEPLLSIATDTIRPKGGAARARMRSGCLILPEDTGASSTGKQEKEQEVAELPEAAEAAKESEEVVAMEPSKEPEPEEVAADPPVQNTEPAASPVVAGPQEAEVVPKEEPLPPVQGDGPGLEQPAVAAAEAPAQSQSKQEPPLPPKEELAQQLPTEPERAAPAKDKEEPPKKTMLELRQTTALSPKHDEDNYEISEKGENSDDGETEPDRSHKHVPKWCESFLGELQAQASLDPDSIFGTKVPKCDLDIVFTDAIYKAAGKDRPRRKRGSSQDWKKDRLRSNEIREYRKKMGQIKPWTTNSKTPLGLSNATVQ